MKVKDGIIGLIIGDALGVPVEFSSKAERDRDPVTDMRAYGTYRQPKGTWSDDSSMTIATMTSITNKKKIDYDDIMEEFLNWSIEGKHTNSADGMFDIGNTTNNALIRYYNGAPALEAGGRGERDNGNGSLMRILPMAFIKGIDYDTIENVSSLTHGHIISRIACVLYIEIAKSMLENDLEIKEHVERACDKVKKHYKGEEALKNFERIFSNDLDDVRGRGFVVGSLECVIHCLLNTDNYKDAVLKAVNFGEDTDTTAAICGGLAGIYYGYDSIPTDWINSINRIDEVLSLCEKYEAFCDES
ncbi:MAG: ADP-ribosylglycohydrolase family protein [Methanobrevibacter sp.]|nr:ADP-ribosylglycohydrolase family protein [Methanobrevibacter sp.]